MYSLRGCWCNILLLAHAISDVKKMVIQKTVFMRN